MRKLARELLDHLAGREDDKDACISAAKVIEDARTALVERKAAEDAALLKAAVDAEEWGRSYSLMFWR